MPNNSKKPLLSLKDSIELKVRSKYCYDKIINLKSELDYGDEWSLISHSYISNNINFEMIDEEYVYFNSNLNKGFNIIINEYYKLAYAKLLSEKDFSKYNISVNVKQKNLKK